MNNSFKNLFNKTDTIIAIIIYAMIVFLWNAADNFDSVSDLFAQNIPPQLFPQILLITIGWSLHKKQSESSKKFLRIFLFYGFGYILLISRIPWSNWL